jgi:GNAT superfamily N-acetyltransferase
VAIIRQARVEDVPALLELQRACYPFLSTISLWNEGHLVSHQLNFPEGQLVAEDKGRIVGHCATFRVKNEVALTPHTFREITQRGTFDRHDPEGDVLYGAEIMVHPEYRRRGIGKALYRARFDLMRRLGIPRFAAGGRIPGYDRFANIMDVEDYVRQVKEGKLTDRVLTAQLRSGLRVMGVLRGYLSDPKSRDNATLLVFDLAEADAKPAA